MSWVRSPSRGPCLWGPTLLLHAGACFWAVGPARCPSAGPGLQVPLRPRRRSPSESNMLPLPCRTDGVLHDGPSLATGAAHAESRWPRASASGALKKRPSPGEGGVSMLLLAAPDLVTPDLIKANLRHIKAA